MNKSILCLAICSLFFCFASAQKFEIDRDTSYYSTYRSMLTARVYLSRKYNVLSFNPPAPATSFKYRATTSLNLGIGATYHLSLIHI